MKYSKNFERDYEFYLNSMDEFSFSGKPMPEIEHDENGVDAKQCVFIYDSQGKMVPCREPELASRILNTKASINLHIKMFAQSLAMGTYVMWEIEEIFNNAPDWVITSIEKQAYKMGWLGNEYNQDQEMMYREYMKKT